MDKTLADSFPPSDPPSSLPDPENARHPIMFAICSPLLTRYHYCHVIIARWNVALMHLHFTPGQLTSCISFRERVAPIERKLVQNRTDRVFFAA